MLMMVKSVEDIEPAADTAQNSTLESPLDSPEEFLNKNHIKRVDWLREQIKIRLEEFESENLVMVTGFLNGLVVQHLSEARFWLGFELHRVKEESEAKDAFLAKKVKTKNEA